MERGTDCLIDGIQLRKAEITFTPLGPAISATFVLVNTKTGAVLGARRKKMGWPDTVKEPLAALVKELEGVVAAEVFAQHEHEGKPTTISEYLKKSESDR